ncbi:prephenate dehydratase [Parahypoxylon ruwenzoriense]
MGSKSSGQQANGRGAAAESSAKKPAVCFLGPKTSYTHQATLDTFPEDKFDLIPVQTIKDIFTTTQSGRATYGVVPFENSTNGAVVPTLDQFADRAGEYPDLSVCAEIYLDVHHCLLGYAQPSSAETAALSSELSSSATTTATTTTSSPSGGDSSNNRKEPPLHPLAHIRRVYSHPQAFGQVGAFLGSRLRGIETIDVSSTSRAAELAKEDVSGSSAAVSSAAAARALGLDVLARNIEDRDDNTTRFFVLRRGAAGGDEEWIQERRSKRRKVVLGGGGEGEDRGERQGGISPAGDEVSAVYSHTKSLVSFTVPHRSPGALADVLECFRRAGLNLTSIGSRPALALAEPQAGDDHDGGGGGGEGKGKGKGAPAPFQYVFFVEFEGHRSDDPQGRVRDALEKVARVAGRCRWLGSWENMRC